MITLSADLLQTIAVIVTILVGFTSFAGFVASGNKKSEERMSVRSTQLDERLSGQITQLDAKLSSQIAQLDAKIDRVDERLSSQITQLDAKLSARIDKVDDRLRTVQIERGRESGLLERIVVAVEGPDAHDTRRHQSLLAVK